MKGGIYSRQRCPVCGSGFRLILKDGLACERHPHMRATRFIVKFGKTWKNIRSFDQAERFLTGLRFKSDEGIYDPRDYQRDNPLGIENLMEQWLEIKEKTVKPGTLKNLKSYRDKTVNYFGNRNIKSIEEGDLEDCVHAQNLSDKSKFNLCSALHDFFTWTWKRNRKNFKNIEMPEFPTISFNLGYRNIVSKKIQLEILEEIKRISYRINPKIYLGVKWLCTYFAVRPTEMISLKEGHIDLGNGYLFFEQTKEGEFKRVPLIDEDIEILKTFPRGLPEVLFFRHPKGISGVKEGESFGARYLYKWWKRACENLGIEGVDLYGGTKHSTVTALRKEFSPEQIKRGSMHKTNKAFDRYLQIGADDLRAIYVATVSQPEKLQDKKGKMLKFKE